MLFVEAQHLHRTLPVDLLNRVTRLLAVVPVEVHVEPLVVLFDGVDQHHVVLPAVLGRRPFGLRGSEGRVVAGTFVETAVLVRFAAGVVGGVGLGVRAGAFPCDGRLALIRLAADFAVIFVECLGGASAGMGQREDSAGGCGGRLTRACPRIPRFGRISCRSPPT